MKKIFTIVRRFLYIIAMVAFLVVLSILKKNPDTCENMTRGIVRNYNRFLGTISGFISFVSLTELLFVGLAIVGIVILVFSIIAFVKKDVAKGIGRLLLIPTLVLMVVTDYAFSCELAYNRLEMPLPYYENEVSRTDFVDIYNYFTDDLNSCIEQLEFLGNGDLASKPLKEITSEVKKAYAIVNDDYFHPYFGSVKPMLSSFAYREFQITGVTFNPLGEANINTMNTNANIPLCVAHELAHTRGVMREDDANKLAFYVCLNSTNPYLRYSAYATYYSQIMVIGSASYLTSEELEQCHKVNIAYYKTISHEMEYWKEHDLLAHIGDFINNLYIKSSGVQEGTTSYYGGTTYEFDPTTNKLHPSLYQKLFFDKYYHQ